MASADCSVFTQTVKLNNFVYFKLYLVRKAKPFIQAALQLRTGEPRQCDPAVLTPPVSPAVALGPVKSNKKRHSQYSVNSTSAVLQSQHQIISTSAGTCTVVFIKFWYFQLYIHCGWSFTGELNMCKDRYHTCKVFFEVIKTVLRTLFTLKSDHHQTSCGSSVPFALSNEQFDTSQRHYCIY